MQEFIPNRGLPPSGGFVARASQAEFARAVGAVGIVALTVLAAAWIAVALALSHSSRPQENLPHALTLARTSPPRAHDAADRPVPPDGLARGAGSSSP